MGTRGERVLIGVAGGTASGKSLVANRILESLGSRRVTIVRQDHYYNDLASLSREERARVNFDHPSAFDTPLLRTQLAALLRGEQIAAPSYDYCRHLRLPETTSVRSRPVIVLEGILVLADEELRSMMDIKVFVDTDSDIRLMRRIRRDVAKRGRNLASVLEQYERDVRPMHSKFVEPTRRFADMVIPEGGRNKAGIERLCEKIISLLEERGIDAKEER